MVAVLIGQVIAVTGTLEDQISPLKTAGMVVTLTALPVEIPRRPPLETVVNQHMAVPEIDNILAALIFGAFLVRCSRLTKDRRPRPRDVGRPRPLKAGLREAV